MEGKPRTHSELFFHFIWATKERLAMIDEEIEAAVKKIFFSKAKDLKIHIVEAEGAFDHVHVLLRSNPSGAPADIAKHLKGASSHFVNQVILKNDKLRSLYWQDGYAVYSVSPGDVRRLRSYIRNQKAHHRSGNILEEFEMP